MEIAPTSSCANTSQTLPEHSVDGVATNQRYDSSLTSQKKDSCVRDLFGFLLRPVMAILRFVGGIFTWIRDTLFPWIPYKPTEETLNWVHTRDTLQKMVRLVTGSSAEENRQEKYDAVFEKLPPVAVTAFREEMGYTIAATKLPADQQNSRVAQEEWLKANDPSAEINLHLKDLQSDVLKQALDSFYARAVRHTRVPLK